MPTYKYRAYGAGGRESAGAIEAEGPRDAVRRLRAEGLHPREVREREGRGRWWRPRRGEVGGASLALLTRRLGVLLRAGVPLIEALRALGDEGGGASSGRLIEGVRERVAQGASLARALGEHPEAFPEFYTSMVEAGERSGTLDGVLLSLADYLEGQSEVREQVRAAMLYPLIVMGVGLAVLVVLFTYVVPKIVVIFENSHAALPLVTRSLIWVSSAFTHLWWAIPIAAMAGAIGGRRLVRAYRPRVDRALMRAFAGLYLSRFATTLAFLLEAGLPLLRSLELAGRTSGNTYIRGLSQEAARRVSEGASLASALDGIPPVMRELVSTGERSGQLPSVLREAGASYAREFEASVKRALTALGPAMILVMGMAVGYIVFAILLPLFELNQLIK